METPAVPAWKQTAHWKLKAKADQRFRAGHPWVFSNELSTSPKGIEGGQPIELSDAQGRFLARGYGNPQSLIAFRALTRDPDVEEPMGPEFFLAQLCKAASLRSSLGFMPASHRLIFGEADELPGLIIDRYLVPQTGQVFVAQAHTAGAQKLAKMLTEVWQTLLKEAYSVSWEDTAIVLRNDVGSRELEGLTIDEPKTVKTWSAGELGVRPIALLSAGGGSPVTLNIDLDHGQKTGFYLDQFANIRLLVDTLKRSRGGVVRVLDLCTYVGQWSVQLANAFKDSKLEFTLVDASQPALDLARRNLEPFGVKVEAVKADVIGGLSGIEDRSFDLVICDPPALIKGRKALGPGAHAYLQLNTDVFRVVREEGWVVSCSCSQLFSEQAFGEMLSKAARRADRTVQWVARGGHSPDHPMLASFPEGHYLKCWIGRVR